MPTQAAVPKRIHQKLEEIGKAMNLRQVALTTVPSFSDQDSEIYLNEINPAFENTIIIYKQRNIVSKFINLKPSDLAFKNVSAALDRTKGQFFHLTGPKH